MSSLPLSSTVSSRTKDRYTKPSKNAIPYFLQEGKLSAVNTNIDYNQGILLDFRDLTFKAKTPASSLAQLLDALPILRSPAVPDVETGLGQQPSRGNAKVLLDNVSGKVLPGEIVAIIGSSGSGKTLLLNLLSGRLSNDASHQISGAVTLNGRLPSEAWRSIIGYVEQKEKFYPLLTVEETVRYSAVLRLSNKKYTYEQKRRAVDKVIHLLGLSLVKNNCVGEGGHSRISGGERKRVNIATELACDPNILFLDEPTTGLDSFTAYYTIKLLKNLAKNTGKCVLLVIHQPGFDILELFDRIFLLARGKMVFQGTISGREYGCPLYKCYSTVLIEAVVHFDRLGFKLPEHTNPSDYFLGKPSPGRVLALPHYCCHITLDVLTMDARTSELLQKSSERIAVLQNAWAAIEASTGADLVPYELRHTEHIDEIDPGTASIVLPFPKSRAHVLKAAIPDNLLLDKIDAEKNEWNTNCFEEIRLLFMRNMKEKLRDQKLLSLEIFQIVVFILLIGLVFVNLDHTQADVNNYVGVIFFYTINITFTVISTSLNIFPNERSIVSKERTSKMYRSVSFYVAKFGSEIIFYWSSNLIYATAIYWIVGLQSLASLYFFYLLISFTFVTAIQSLGLAVGSISRNVDMSQIIGSTLVVVFLLFGGNLIFPATIPGYLVWIFWLSPLQYAYKALLQNQFQSLTFTCQDAVVGCITSGDQALASFDMTNPDKWICFIILVCFTFFFILTGYIGFTITTAPSRPYKGPSGSKKVGSAPPA